MFWTSRNLKKIDTIIAGLSCGFAGLLIYHSGSQIGSLLIGMIAGVCVNIGLKYYFHKDKGK